MQFLQVVKEKQAATDVMFEPLHDIIDMLRNYGVAIPEKTLVQLQVRKESGAQDQKTNERKIQSSAQSFVFNLRP